MVKLKDSEVFSCLSYINIHYCLKHRIPLMHRQFFRQFSQDQDYVDRYCNDRKKPFHFACRKWYLYDNPQS